MKDIMRIFLRGLISILVVGSIACQSDIQSPQTIPTVELTTSIQSTPTQLANEPSLESTETPADNSDAIAMIDSNPTVTPDLSSIATLVVIPPTSTTVIGDINSQMTSTATAIIVTEPSSTTVNESVSPTKIVYLDDAWANVWLCNSATVESEDLTGGGSQTCSVSTEVVGNNLVITSTGIPNHDFESTLGCCASEQNQEWTIPLEPELSNADPVAAPERGAVAFTVTGVAIYGPEEGPGGDAVALEYEYFVEDRQAVDLGICGGHAGPGGEYHYHYDSNCMHWHEDSQDIAGYTLDSASSVISKVIGFAFDGFPIYSSYEQDQSGNSVEVTSSYRLISGENGYNGIEDYVYVEDLSDLDECNGHFGSTSEIPEGTYHYHSTLTNGNGDLGFPYFPLCYKGTVNEDNYQSTDLGRGGPPPRP
tara:strand:+ start:3095 stop:4360 length:1266 start_codon:yes stop_codon:yes gene_type:complete